MYLIEKLFIVGIAGAIFLILIYNTFRNIRKHKEFIEKLEGGDK